MVESRIMYLSAARFHDTQWNDVIVSSSRARLRQLTGASPNKVSCPFALFSRLHRCSSHQYGDISSHEREQTTLLCEFRLQICLSNVTKNLGPRGRARGRCWLIMTRRRIRTVDAGMRHVQTIYHALDVYQSSSPPSTATAVW